MKIFSLGQSGFRITTADGTVVMTDPWLGPHLLKSYKTPIDANSVARCDILLVSHCHMDHLDARALRMAKRLGTQCVGARRAVRRARSIGINNVVEMKAGDCAHVYGMTIHAVTAVHPLAGDAVGFVVEADKTLYFSGDTRLHPNVVEDLKPFDIDIAFLQIACAVYFFRKDGMDISDAARLARQIKPKVAVPMHYHDRFRHPNPGNFRSKLADTDIQVDIIGLGEEINY